MSTFITSGGIDESIKFRESHRKKKLIGIIRYNKTGRDNHNHLSEERKERKERESVCLLKNLERKKRVRFNIMNEKRTCGIRKLSEMRKFKSTGSLMIPGKGKGKNGFLPEISPGLVMKEKKRRRKKRRSVNKFENMTIKDFWNYKKKFFKKMKNEKVKKKRKKKKKRKRREKKNNGTEKNKVKTQIDWKYPNRHMRKCSKKKKEKEALEYLCNCYCNNNNNSISPWKEDEENPKKKDMHMFQVKENVSKMSSYEKKVLEYLFKNRKMIEKKERFKIQNIPVSSENFSKSFFEKNPKECVSRIQLECEKKKKYLSNERENKNDELDSRLYLVKLLFFKNDSNNENYRSIKIPKL